MFDDNNSSSGGVAERVRIEVHEPSELAYWSDRFGVAKQALIEAVRRAGPIAADVQKYLEP